MTLPDRTVAARWGRETVEFLRAGGYRALAGHLVDLRAAIDAAAEGTREYPPERPVDRLTPRGSLPRVTVQNRSVLKVGREMAAAGSVAALNFAAGSHPGGGFLTGARAQEESMARSSGLFACLEGRDFYARHSSVKDAMSSHYALYSPEVPFFRTDDGTLLDAPWQMDVITCAAVDGVALRRYEPERESQVESVMRNRTHRVLAIAAEEKQRRLILGAWGCGAFGLDGDMMAGIFREAVTESAGSFDDIVFAIIDWSPERKFIGPFDRAFEAMVAAADRAGA